MANPTNASLDPWELAKSRFLEDLDPHEKDIFNNATLENIYYSTSNTNRDDAEKSKTRGVVRKLGPLVSAIESYGGAFDAFAQISPQYLSPIWGSIRVLLVLAGSYSNFYDRIVDTLGRIGDILPRFRDYERIYNGQKHKRLYQALSNAYLDIITLCSEFRTSIRKQKNSKVRRLLKPLAFDKQFDEAIERFRRHRQNVVDEAETCHMIEAAEQRDAQLVLFAEERRRKLLERLSKVDCKHRHRKLKESRHEGTGAWFTSSPEFEQWMGASYSSVLCCYGIPGCGKSVLVSSVIDSFDVTGTVVFYYCDYSDKRTLEPSNVFATLARQALEQIEILPETLALEIEQVEHDGEKLANSQAALIILQKSLEVVPGPVFVVLDGLDEAIEPSQLLICNNLKKLIEKSGVSIKLFITGRDELESLLMLDSNVPFARVPVSSAAISLDIENYVRSSTRRRIADGLLVITDPNLEQLIVDELVKGAKGMFLWVEFQLQDLCEPESDHGIRLVLQNLPRSLGETYKRLLNRIEGVERRDMIQRLFKWIVCAREPINLEEMREAVAFTLEDLSYDPRKLPTDLHRLVRACGNLVVVDEETHVVQLAHHTVQQYLLQQGDSLFQFTTKEANVMAGEFCVAYLNFSNFESQITRYADNKNTDMLALAKIASRGPVLPSEHPAQKVVHALNSFRNPRLNAPDINMTRYVPPQRQVWQPANFSFLSYVIAHWLWHTKLFDIDDDVNVEGVSRRALLFEKLVLGKKLLFDFRPWGNFDHDIGETSSIALLGWALMANHRYLIQFISFDFSWAWYATCSKYSWTVSTIPHLNRLDLTYDSTSYTSDSPDLVWLFSRLLRACQKAHIGAIKAVNIENMTELQDMMIQYLAVAAAEKGQLQLVEYFWDKLITPVRVVSVYSDRTKDYPLTAIEHAAISGYSQVVSYLAVHGGVSPIISSYPGTFRAFFDEAIINNNIPIIESLLTLLKFKNKVGGLETVCRELEQYLSNTLVNAVAHDRREVVRTLLKNCVGFNSITFDDALCGNPKLQHALADMWVAIAISSVNGPEKLFGRENLARLIQKSIAPTMDASRPTGKVYKICEILEAAVRGNDEQYLRRLYRSLVFPSSDLGPAAAMFAAVDHGTQEVMELVHKYRADFGSNIHVRDYNGATPLLYAIERKASVFVIRCLLSHGADPSAVDNDGETVLYKAAATCNDEYLDCLFGLTYDADQDYLDAWDVIIALDICLSQRNSEAWNRLAKACRDRLPTPIEKRGSTRPKKTRTTLDSLKQTLSMSRDGHELLLECWTTYEKARGRHLVQEEVKPSPFPVPLIHAEELKTTKKLSEAAAALLERQASEDLLLKYGFGNNEVRVDMLPRR